MRDIMCRGKRESDGKWLYGQYLDKRFCNTDFPCIVPLKSERSNDNWGVIPETVGQYTGLEDKNGKKIFEGDECVVCSGYKYAYGTIEFKCGCFFLNSKNGIPLGLWQLELDKDTIMVIGNLHDNPELLEV